MSSNTDQLSSNEDEVEDLDEKTLLHKQSCKCIYCQSKRILTRL